MMKAYLLILILLCLTTLSYGQDKNDKSESKPSIVKKSHANEMTPVYNENLDDLCVKYKAIKNTGIVLSSAGAGLVVGGSIMMHSAKEGNIYINDSGRPYRGTSPVRKGGIAAVTVGALSLIVGLPMAAWGAIKIKSTCHNASPSDNALLQLNSGQDGVGVALKF
jgi:hypothetical protein